MFTSRTRRFCIYSAGSSPSLLAESEPFDAEPSSVVFLIELLKRCF